MARRLSLVIAALSLALAPAWSFSPIASLVRSHRSGTSQRAVVALRCSQEPDVASRKIEGMSRRNALISMAGLGVLAFSGMASVAASPVKPVQSTSAELEGVLDGKSEWQTVLDNRLRSALARSASATRLMQLLWLLDWTYVRVVLAEAVRAAKLPDSN